MKKAKKINLLLEDLKVESFVTSVETKNLFTGLPRETVPVTIPHTEENNCTYFWCETIKGPRCTKELSTNPGECNSPFDNQTGVVCFFNEVSDSFLCWKDFTWIAC